MKIVYVKFLLLAPLAAEVKKVILVLFGMAVEFMFCKINLKYFNLK